MSKIVVTSGYFIWLHVGHIELFKRAKELGDSLIVILNNDYQQILKYQKVIVPFEQRKKILESIKYIDKVIESEDRDKTVCKTLEIIKPDIFAKGGDRYKFEIPERKICEKYNIKIIDGLGNKIQSSSELLKNVKLP